MNDDRKLTEARKIDRYSRGDTPFNTLISCAEWCAKEEWVDVVVIARRATGSGWDAYEVQCSGGNAIHNVLGLMEVAKDNMLRDD